MTKQMLAFLHGLAGSKLTILEVKIVLNYMSLVIYNGGLLFWSIREPFLKQILSGLREMLPSRKDFRAVVILPKQVLTETFVWAISERLHL